MLRTTLLALVLAIPVAAQVSSPARPVELPALESLRAPQVEEAVRRTLLDAAWLTSDPGLAGATDVKVRAHRVGTRFVARVTPLVDGTIVEGADRVIVVDDDGLRHVGGRTSLQVGGAFRLAEHEATAAALDAVKGSLITDATVERVSGLARKVWVSTSAGLRPAWRVRVPTWRIQDLSDVWVDAETGAILKKQATARLGQTAAPTAARVFQYAPAADGLEVADLVDVNLVGVRGVLGGPLKGDHFETANCCKFVVCNDNSQDCLQNIPAGQTAADVATCATQQDIDDGIAVESVIQPPEGIPSSALPIPSQFASFVPDPLYVKVVFCAEIPRARSVAGDGERPAGWFFTPVDGDRSNTTRCGEAGADPIGCAAEEDEFAEVQVYHGTQVFFEHIRGVLDGGDTFCLGGQSQLCEADGSPTLGDDGEPTRPFHIATNVLFPAFDTNALFTQIAPPNFGGQGRGAEPGNPVIIDDFQRLPNAAFVPALEGGPVQTPPELQAFAVLFNRPFDSNVYFQGSRDFAYDGDVTRHEFTHAIVHSFVPGLASLGRDAFGSHAESGALNEGWADYFSSSFADDAAVGDYAAQGLVAGELGLRNNDNDFRCPDNIIGQVHNDSEHWAGSLWAIRKEHLGGGGDVRLLDRALLEALAQADNDEDMTRAAERAETAIRAALGDALADFAHTEFVERGIISCQRVWPLAVVDEAGTGITVTRKDILSQPGIADVGVANFAPSVLQFRVDVPAGSAGFTLKWQQAAGGGGLGGGGGEAPMAVAVAEVPSDDPAARIEWRYEGTSGNLAVPYLNDVALDFNETTSAVTLGAAENNGVQAASFTQTLTSDPCAARSFVASIVSLDGGAQLQNIDVDNIDTDVACPTGDGDGDGDGDGVDEGCTCSGTSKSSATLGLLVLAVLGLRRRRR